MPYRSSSSVAKIDRLKAKALSIPPALAVSDKRASGFSHWDYMKMQRKGAMCGSKLFFPLFYKSSKKNPKGANSTLLSFQPNFPEPSSPTVSDVQDPVRLSFAAVYREHEASKPFRDDFFKSGILGNHANIHAEPPQPILVIIIIIELDFSAVPRDDESLRRDSYHRNVHHSTGSVPHDFSCLSPLTCSSLLRGQP
ncbi:unnamed protein product [Leuciscus chuanchicus]